MHITRGAENIALCFCTLISLMTLRNMKMKRSIMFLTNEKLLYKFIATTN